MNNVVLNFPTFGFVVATRAILGVGIGLLLAEKIPADRRRAIGMTLVGIGAATTVPAALAIARNRRSTMEQSGTPEIPAVV